jgi:hypothetical protein
VFHTCLQESNGSPGSPRNNSDSVEDDDDDDDVVWGSRKKKRLQHSSTSAKLHGCVTKNRFRVVH